MYKTEKRLDTSGAAEGRRLYHQHQRGETGSDHTTGGVDVQVVRLEFLR